MIVAYLLKVYNKLSLKTKQHNILLKNILDSAICKEIEGIVLNDYKKEFML